MLAACSWNVNCARFEEIFDVTYEARFCALRLLVLVLAREYRTLAKSHSACVSRVRGDDPGKDATVRVADSASLTGRNLVAAILTGQFAMAAWSAL
jgi:hypothetical protein